MQIELQVDVDRDRVIDLALDLIWERCCGRAPPAANAMGRLLDQKGAQFRRTGQGALKAAMRPGVEAFLAKLPEHVSSFSTGLFSDLGRTKLICFSERTDSVLMWSHYSESHCGIVLGFSNVDSCDSVYKLAKRVDYRPHPPRFADEEELAAIVAGNAGIPHDVVDRMIFTKSDQWSYEREWRISSGDGREPGSPVEYAGFFNSELRSVCFGVKTLPSTKALLIPLIRERFPDAELLQAHRKSNSYSIEIARLNR
ncbi:DUF2971 domain-containing protein [Cognatilysobacter terrigena]|uniref:DUF2971 domain-containing protein n=1 Tax=Cognatilysobacter terrigena TaxID=2488749 RepID=UPI001414FB96|nr:DUF2971 domain-containing protein [Lysobacter terrigena]